MELIITVQLTSSLTGLDSLALLSKTGGQPHSETFHYEVSEYSLACFPIMVGLLKQKQYTLKTI